MSNLKRWYIYQKERFPLLQFIPMMAMFGFCGLSFSLHMHNPNAKLSDIGIAPYIVAVMTTLIWFMLLRIADEHKDFEEDSKFRPYRPVQRGLVKLKELRYIGIVLGVLQCAMAIWIDWKLLIVLAIVYFWFFLMCKEFFVTKWLKAHPTWYLASHMIILPFINLFTTSIEWLPRDGWINAGIIAFMISSLCDGTVVEVGRKLRAPENEEYGVDTYTHIWGTRKAMFVWLFCVSISWVSTIVEGFFVNVGYELGIAITILYSIAWYIAMRFAKNPTAKNAKVFLWFPGVWEVVQYFMIGLVPFFK